MFRSSSLVVLACVVTLLAACAGLPARGRVGGQSIQARVDSEVARYYLATYLAGQRSDAALHDRIDQVYRSAYTGLPGRGELKHLSDNFSTDFAALYLADCNAQNPANRRFRNSFDAALGDARILIGGRTRLPAAMAGYEVVFVPGYLYKRHPITGADFAVPRAAMQRVGIAHDFVETGEDGAIEANADLVGSAIRVRAHTARRLIIVSASKSGPEVALALTRLGAAQTNHVAAWINIVGTLQGSPLADDRLWEELRHSVGKVDIAGVESLTTERSRQRFAAFEIPEHVFVVNYIGIPLTGNVSFLARTGFLQLRSHGPNDGVSLLSDLILPGGVTFAELGRDHFLLDDRIDVRTLAFAIAVVRWLAGNEATISQTGN